MNFSYVFFSKQHFQHLHLFSSSVCTYNTLNGAFELGLLFEYKSDNRRIQGKSKAKTYYKKLLKYSNANMSNT